MLRAGVELPKELAAAVIFDEKGREVVFKTLWKKKPAAVFFLRHFGCIGCSEFIAHIAPRFAELQRFGVDINFIGNGEAKYIEAFKVRRGLTQSGVKIFTDPSLEIQAMAELRRSWWGAAGPGGIKGFIRAMGNGHSQSSIEGDNAQQGGALLIDTDGTLLFYYRNRDLGDHVDPSDFIDAVFKMAGASQKKVLI